MKSFCVCIISNKKNGSLYIGSTSDLEGRIWEHKNRVDPKSFSAKYDLNKLVYYEELSSATEMVAREKNLKDYRRFWKLNLINQDNPEWNDLSEGW